MRQIIIILFSAILVDNFVLSKFLGICPFLGVSKKLDSAMGMSVAVIFVMVLATAATWPVYYLVLARYQLTYLNTILFILVIAALVQLVEIVLKKYMPSLHRSLGVYLPLITTNCAVLGVTLLNLEAVTADGSSYNLLQSLFNALGAGLGFMLAMVLFAGVRSKMENAVITKSFDGIPITLIAASIVSLAFMGFGGVVDGLFG